MRNPEEARLWLIDGIFLFVLVFWILQLFLVIVGLDAYLAGQKGILIPAAITSVVIAVLNALLVRLIKDKPH